MYEVTISYKVKLRHADALACIADFGGSPLGVLGVNHVADAASKFKKLASGTELKAVDVNVAPEPLPPDSYVESAELVGPRITHRASVVLTLA